jgi:hypothetical protein
LLGAGVVLVGVVTAGVELAVLGGVVDLCFETTR